MFKVEFSTDNAAFDGEDRASECARILSDLARRVGQLGGDNDAHGGPIFDSNGNRVGAWSLSEREED